MRIFEVFPKFQIVVSEDNDAENVAADNNLRLAKQRKQQVKVKAATGNLNKQRKQLADIIKQVTPSI